MTKKAFEAKHFKILFLKFKLGKQKFLAYSTFFSLRFI